MKGSKIDDLLRGVPKYGGVLAFDQIEFITPGKYWVVNSKPSNHPGEHWLVIDWTHKHPFLFDSFGKSPMFYGLTPMRHWKRHLQHPDSVTCGIYCVYYIVHRAKHYSPERMFQHFTKMRIQNDSRIKTWLRKRSKTL